MTEKYNNEYIIVAEEVTNIFEEVNKLPNKVKIRIFNARVDYDNWKHIKCLVVIKE